jgi:hypothetical protein
MQSKCRLFDPVFERILANFELPKLDIPECRSNVELMTTFDPQIYLVFGLKPAVRIGQPGNLRKGQELWLTDSKALFCQGIASNRALPPKQRRGIGLKPCLTSRNWALKTCHL